MIRIVLKQNCQLLTHALYVGVWGVGREWILTLEKPFYPSLRYKVLFLKIWGGERLLTACSFSHLDVTVQPAALGTLWSWEEEEINSSKR